MKLGPLNSAIRQAENVKFATLLTDGRQLHLVVQKTPLLAELAELFPEGRGQETGYHLNASNFFTRDA